MLQERILIRISQILGVLFVAVLVYSHFFGWFYPKQMIVEDTKNYLLEQGYKEEDIIRIDAGYDYRAENKYFAVAKYNDQELGEVEATFVYDVEENIYQQSEK